MATVLTRVNAGISLITDLVGYTIRTNYFLGEALFTLLSWAFGHVTTGTRTLLALLKIMVFDLGQFVEDLGGYVTIGLTAIEAIANFACQLISGLCFAFLSALASFVSVVIGIGTSVYLTISSILDAIKHLAQVGGKSLVLLVHTIPIGLAEGATQVAHTVVAAWLATKTAIITAVLATTDAVYLQHRNVRNLLKGLPGEAYLGCFLLVLLLLVVHYALRAVYSNRERLFHRMYQITMRTLSAVYTGGLLISLSWAQFFAIRTDLRTSVEEELDTSASSSLDSTPPYNLRQRKPGQRSTRTSRIDSIRRQLQAEKESRLCVICSDRRRSVVLLPCRHFSFCAPCINQAIRYHHHCPICRTNIEDVVPVYQ